MRKCNSSSFEFYCLRQSCVYPWKLQRLFDSSSSGTSLRVSFNNMRIAPAVQPSAICGSSVSDKQRLLCPQQQHEEHLRFNTSASAQRYQQRSSSASAISAATGRHQRFSKFCTWDSSSDSDEQRAFAAVISTSAAAFVHRQRQQQRCTHILRQQFFISFSASDSAVFACNSLSSASATVLHALAAAAVIERQRKRSRCQFTCSGNSRSFSSTAAAAAWAFSVSVNRISICAAA